MTEMSGEFYVPLTRVCIINEAVGCMILMAKHEHMLELLKYPQMPFPSADKHMGQYNFLNLLMKCLTNSNCLLQRYLSPHLFSLSEFYTVTHPDSVVL
jgi:hypothetical protein